MRTTKRPEAICMIRGAKTYPHLSGVVLFYQSDEGVVIKTSIKGFPIPSSLHCDQPIIAMHIHDGTSCTGTKDAPFANADGHYNPNHCPHPYHAGDLGNIFINRDGTAMMSMVNDRFVLKDVIGKVMILHQHLDDFTTQPSGSSGAMIACGVIRMLRENRL